MEALYKQYKIIPDIQDIINRQIHEPLQKEINFVINNIIGFNKEYINDWINTNELYLILNKFFVFRKKINCYNNKSHSREIRLYNTPYSRGLYLLFKTDYRNIPAYKKYKSLSLASFNLSILENYFIKNIFYSNFLFDFFIDINKSNYNSNLIITHNNNIFNVEDYNLDNLLDDYNDNIKLNNYRNLFLKENIYNEEFLYYLNIDPEVNNSDFIDLINNKKKVLKICNDRILEFKLKYIDFNTLLIYDYNNNKNYIRDLDKLYKVDLQNLMFDNGLIKWKRLTKKQLIKRLLKI